MNERSVTLLRTLAADPSASINAAMGGWKETLAAYRFFDNSNVERGEIMKAHREATQQRIDNEEVVLVVQDTTKLDFSSHPTTDSGVLNEPHRFGLYDHTQLAFTPPRLCLGVLEVDFYSRTPESLGKARQRKYDPIEEKESYRWLKGYRLADHVPDVSGPRVSGVAV